MSLTRRQAKPNHQSIVEIAAAYLARADRIIIALKETEAKHLEQIEALKDEMKRTREKANEQCYSCDRTEDQRQAECKAGQLLNNVTMIEPGKGSQ